MAGRLLFPDVGDLAAKIVPPGLNRKRRRWAR